MKHAVHAVKLLVVCWRGRIKILGAPYPRVMGAPPLSSSLLPYPLLPSPALSSLPSSLFPSLSPVPSFALPVPTWGFRVGGSMFLNGRPSGCNFEDFLFIFVVEFPRNVRTWIENSVKVSSRSRLFPGTKSECKCRWKSGIKNEERIKDRKWCSVACVGLRKRCNGQN